MPKHPHLTRRGGVFWLRRKVPTDLRDHYAPKSHITFSLKTSDPKEAQRLVRKESVKLDEAFEHIRNFRVAPVQEELPDSEIKRLAALYLHLRLDEDDEIRRDGLWFRDGLGPHEGMNERDFADVGAGLDEWLPAMRRSLARADISIIKAELDVLLEDEGIKLSPTSEAYRKVGLAILRADVQALEVRRQRHQGDPVETPPMPARPNRLPVVPAPASGDITFRDLWDRYRLERKLAPKTEADFATSVRRFEELHGNLPVTAVTKAHARAFKDAMLRIPARLGGADRHLTVPEILKRFEGKDLERLTPRTVNEKSLAAIRAVFGYATANGFRDDNPLANIKAAGEASQEPSRLPYSPAELRTIFGSPVFTEGKRYEGGGGEASKWLPLLGLLTGGRLEELGRLEVADIGTEQGVHYLFIRPGEGTRRVKNLRSRRKVPLHPELIRLGFLEYVQARRDAKDRQLFPALKSERDQRTAAFSQWWKRYTDGLGITDKKKVFHSFRHGVKRALRDAQVDEALAKALMGHADKEVAGRYGLDEEGLGFSLPTLRDALARLVYPGLETVFSSMS